MSLSEKTRDDGLEKAGQRRKADKYRENYSRAVLQDKMRNALYKDSIGMDLDQSDEFMLQNKQFFMKLLREKK